MCCNKVVRTSSSVSRLPVSLNIRSRLLGSDAVVGLVGLSRSGRHRRVDGALESSRGGSDGDARDAQELRGALRS